MLDQLVHKVFRAYKDLLVVKVSVVLLDQLVHKVFRASKAYKVCKDQLAHKVFRAYKVLLELPVAQVHLVVLLQVPLILTMLLLQHQPILVR